jgi:hypothetical protein
VQERADPARNLFLLVGDFVPQKINGGKMSKRYINTAEKTHKRGGNLKWLSAVLLNYPRKYKEKREKRMKTNG